MELKIISVILYANDDKLKPRFINFTNSASGVGVITGYSQRGKSAIISIIDYCLGSSDCNIPIGRIRDKVDKFALYIQIKGENVFLARDCPRDIGQSSDNMYYYNIAEKGENKSLRTNDWIKNAKEYRVNRSFVKAFLSKLAGFENVAISENSKEQQQQLTFRDTAAFQFQPQSIIANPTTIFYKTDTWEHMNRLRTLFPLVLGYKSYEIIRLEKELEESQNTLKDKQKKFDDLKRQYENWQSEIYEHYINAVKLNLTTHNIDIDVSKVNFIKDELNSVVARIRNNTFMKEGATQLYATKLDELEQERDVLQRDLDELRVGLSKIRNFDRSKELYLSDVANEIDNRLRPIDYFLNLSGTNICPFCDSVSDKAVNQLIELKNAQERNRSVITESKTLDFSFEREKSKFQNDIRDKEQAILKVDNNIQILINQNRDASRKIQQIFEFAGTISTVLKNLLKIEPSSDLAKEIEEDEVNIAKRISRLKILRAQFDRDICLKKVSKSIDNYLKILPIEERENKEVRLDPEKSASIKVHDKRTLNTNFLSKLGSGSNHMCYHIATMLGLHEYFLTLPESRKVNYVSSFIVLDQPSQVYFPENFNEARTIKDLKKKTKISKDMVDTKAIFEACSTFIQRTGGKCQIIILEHATEDAWKGLTNVSLIEDWRGENESSADYKALIPKNWLV
ncbi:DUF3732 domain-containing protein [Pedobacter psychrotolerans]|uniref:DUF3732 domain-containing protein n=1 Tax=Pedobacter psychrotolerans TaxID=1843235 RepID=UPI003F9A628A